MLTDEANLSIEVMRGDFVEESHEVAACLCDASGYVRARIGSPHVTTWRSAAKPFQLEACLTMLPRDTVDNLSPAEIAVESAQINCGPDPEPLPPEGVIAELAGPSAIQVMHFNFQMGCCPQSEILASSDSAQSTITVTYNLWDDLCDCICDLDAMFTLTGIPAGSWTLELPGGVNREFVIE